MEYGTNQHLKEVERSYYKMHSKVFNYTNLDKYRHAMTWEEMFYEDPRPLEEILEEENQWEEYDI